MYMWIFSLIWPCNYLVRIPIEAAYTRVNHIASPDSIPSTHLTGSSPQHHPIGRLSLASPLFRMHFICIAYASDPKFQSQSRLSTLSRAAASRTCKLPRLAGSRPCCLQVGQGFNRKYLWQTNVRRSRLFSSFASDVLHPCRAHDDGLGQCLCLYICSSSFTMAVVLFDVANYANIQTVAFFSTPCHSSPLLHQPQEARPVQHQGIASHRSTTDARNVNLKRDKHGAEMRWHICAGLIIGQNSNVLSSLDYVLELSEWYP